MNRHPHLTGDDLARAVADAARCRAQRAHRMELIPGEHFRRPNFGCLLTFRCELCGVLRFDIVQRRTGELLSRSYDHPDWYLAANEQRMDAAWWRVKWWESLPEDRFLEADRVVPIRRKRRAS